MCNDWDIIGSTPPELLSRGYVRQNGKLYGPSSTRNYTPDYKSIEELTPQQKEEVRRKLAEGYQNAQALQDQINAAEEDKKRKEMIDNYRKAADDPNNLRY